MGKEINMIFSMTDFEMKLILESINKSLFDKSIDNNRHNSALKKAQIKLTRMIERQKPYVWNFKWLRVLVVLLFNSFSNFNMGELQMNKENKDGLLFLVALFIGFANIILMYWVLY